MKEKLSKIIKPIFTISLMLFMALGIIIVLVQLFSLLIMNGELSMKVYDGLRFWAIRLSCIAAFAGFIMSYLKEPQKE